MSIDLDAIAAALAERTPGKWSTSGAGEHGENTVRGPDDEMIAQGMSMDHAEADARAIVALVNAGDALLRVARAAKAMVDARDAASDASRAYRRDGNEDTWCRVMDASEAVRVAERDLLAAVRAMKETGR